MKRTLAIILCLVMVFSFVIPTVGATEPESPVEQSTEPMMYESTESFGEGDELATDEIAELPVCSCEAGHLDGCPVPMYYDELCKKPAQELYDQWRTLPLAAQEYVLTHLEANVMTRYIDLVELLNDDPSSVASTSKGKTEVTAAGVPQNSTVSMTLATAANTTAADSCASEYNATASRVFSWDISVEDAAGRAWQPDGTVNMEITLPAGAIQKYEQIFVVHVDDEGNSSILPATVTEAGKVLFETDGFSTFAGFTVDFEYDGRAFSINGMESVLLSELFDALQMPLSSNDVTMVEFSDPSLISVTQQDNDWLLTSLKAFNTRQTLTVSMKDGRVYVINVTDANITIKIGSGDTDPYTVALNSSNQGSIDWYADGDGHLNTGAGDGCTDLETWGANAAIWVEGSGGATLTINIKKHRRQPVMSRWLSSRSASAVMSML